MLIQGLKIILTTVLYVYSLQCRGLMREREFSVISSRSFAELSCLFCLFWVKGGEKVGGEGVGEERQKSPSTPPLPFFL